MSAVFSIQNTGSMHHIIIEYHDMNGGMNIDVNERGLGNE